ncbi:5290_t:CDS:2 [Ambispora gerdemannii]|uniref:Beta-hexosaminidase n=1 Tax=Ambispora gerdemannii TaxID=144530 RepID=A0A9N8UYT5_9GLOM|nr:5290_t:CDS:2 [Ambispora gerdemannii]
MKFSHTISLFSLIFINIFIIKVDALWPIPKKWSKGISTLKIHPSIKINFNNRFSDPFIQQTIHAATQRLQDFLTNEKFSPPNKNNLPPIDLTFKILESLNIELHTENVELSLDTDESYDIWIPNASPLLMTLKAHLRAKSVYGVLHGLTTFSQLIYADSGNDEMLIMPFAPHRIFDSPKYRHRGLMLDTSRNYYPVEDILRTLDAMSWTKLNVFHWHIVDQHSWPVASEVFPELSEKGSYDPKNMIYTKRDIETIVHYAKQRGIRIIPEFDMPGHTAAIALSHPEIPIGTMQYAYEPPSGQFDPTANATYAFIDKLITEMASWFPDKYFHGGGDEVNLRCWYDAHKVQEYISLTPNTTNKTNIDDDDSEIISETMEPLVHKFVTKQHEIIRNQGKIPMAWQELIVNQRLNLGKDTIVQVWNGDDNVKRVVRAGYKVVSGPAGFWYLDCGHGNWLGNYVEGNSWCGHFKTWQWMYSYNPRNGLSDKEAELVIGGEVLLWSEQADATNFETTLWPRTAVTAEILWSGNYDSTGMTRNVREALPRLTEFRFRLVGRGIRAEPLQPLWCARTGTCDRP